MPAPPPGNIKLRRWTSYTNKIPIHIKMQGSIFWYIMILKNYIYPFPSPLRKLYYSLSRHIIFLTPIVPLLPSSFPILQLFYTFLPIFSFLSSFLPISFPFTSCFYPFTSCFFPLYFLFISPLLPVSFPFTSCFFPLYFCFFPLYLLFLSLYSCFFALSSFFSYSSPFSLPFLYFSPKWHQLIYAPPPPWGGGGVCPVYKVYKPLLKCGTGTPIREKLAGGASLVLIHTSSSTSASDDPGSLLTTLEFILNHRSLTLVS